VIAGFPPRANIHVRHSEWRLRAHFTDAATKTNVRNVGKT
jgi:hypothetical protein